MNFIFKPLQILFKIITRIFWIIVFLILIVGITGHILLKQYTGLSIFEGLSLFLDATQSQTRPITYSQDDIDFIFDQIGQSLYLKQGVLNTQIIDNIIDQYEYETQINNTRTDNTKTISNNISKNLLPTNNQTLTTIRDTNTLLDYIFDEVINEQNIDRTRLSNFDYHHPDIYLAKFTDKSLAALLDSTLTKALYAANQSDDLNFDYSMDSLRIVDITMDKSLYYIDYQETMVTRMYASLGISKHDFVGIVLQNIQDGFAKNTANNVLNLFMPDTIYFEALIGLSHPIPIQIGFNNLRIGEQYNLVNNTIKNLSNNIKGLQSIDLDESISKPVNDYIAPLIKNLQPYVDVNDFDDGTLQIDLVGLVLNLSGINNPETSSWFETKDIALSLKAIFGDKPNPSTNEYNSWYYQVDSQGQIVLDANEQPIQYQNYSYANIEQYKKDFAEKTTHKYRLNLKKPSYDENEPDNSQNIFQYGLDYTTVEELESLEDINWTQTFDDLMAFFVHSQKGDRKFYIEQFQPIAMIQRFADIITIDITDPDAVEKAIKELMQQFKFTFDGAALFALVSDQFENIFNTSALQKLQIRLESIALKNINVESDSVPGKETITHTTLLLGLSITPQQAQGSQGSFVNKIMSSVFIATEIDITINQSTNFNRLAPFLALNSLTYQESNILLGIFSRFNVGVTQNNFASLTQSISQVFDKIATANEYLQVEFEVEQVNE